MAKPTGVIYLTKTEMMKTYDQYKELQKTSGSEITKNMELLLFKMSSIGRRELKIPDDISDYEYYQQKTQQRSSTVLRNYEEFTEHMYLYAVGELVDNKIAYGEETTINGSKIIVVHYQDIIYADLRLLFKLYGLTLYKTDDDKPYVDVEQVSSKKTKYSFTVYTEKYQYKCEILLDAKTTTATYKIEATLIVGNHFAGVNEGTCETMPNVLFIPVSFFQEIMAHVERDGSGGAGKTIIIPGKQVISDKGIDFLGNLETEGSKYNVYDNEQKLIGINSADIGDGGITFGFGHYVSYNDTTKQNQLKDLYGLDFKTGVFVPIDLCIKIKRDDLITNKIDNVKNLDRFVEDNNILFTQYQFDALVCMVYLRRIPDKLKNLIITKQKDGVLYGDYETEFFNIALEDFKSLSSFNKYGAGWTKRLKNETELYFHNDYNRKHKS